MRVEVPIIAVLISVLFFAGLFSIISGLESSYSGYGISSSQDDLALNANTTSIKRTLENVSASSKIESEEMQEEFEKINPDRLLSAFDYAKFGFKVLLKLFKNIPRLATVVSSVLQVIGIDPMFFITFMVIVIVLFVIAAITLLLGGQNG